MFDFILRKGVIGSAQKFIDKLDPKVNVHVPAEIPLPSARELKKFCKIVSKINGLEPTIQALSDSELSGKTKEFQDGFKERTKDSYKKYLDLKEELRKTADANQQEDLTLQMDQAYDVYSKEREAYLDEILPEAFAVVRETGWRVLKMRHYDVQMVGGIVLHKGNIAEMTTGEGKTLTSTLPTYLNALTGEGAHVVTVNDYLAERDRNWMAPIFEFLGLSVGVILHDMRPPERKKAYGCDITYGTNNEFGFDYLRDNMVSRVEDMVQRQYHFAIVDEVDSILIDEARTPLIISGPAEQSTDKYAKCYRASLKLNGRRITEQDQVDAKYEEIDLAEGYDYLADEKAKTVSLTDEGEAKAAELLGIDNLHELETMEDRHHILQALKAKEFFVKDVDYVVQDGQVVIVDEFTGRMMPGRRWSDGLHQAVEAREGIKIERENQTLATITFQNYFRLYDKLSGMTGTAETEATEFSQIYDLECLVIPTNRPIQRKNYPDAVYRSQAERYNAIVEEIEECHKVGQPVLVGTVSIEKSELLGRMLQQKGIPHNVLNAKFHGQEAAIIAQAGRLGAVTIATNMAGRGTDIVLGGNPEFLAQAAAYSEMKDETDPQKREEIYLTHLEKFRAETKAEGEKVKELGGLAVLGSERHESRRIDNQLRGRQGRQGDPGASRFYVALDDDLMRLFASDKLIGLMDKMGLEEGQVLEHPWLSKSIETAQKRVEGHNFEIRKYLLDYDNVMNKQREVIYGLRRTILESDEVKNLITAAIEDLSYILVQEYLFASVDGEKNVDELRIYLKTKFDCELSQTNEEVEAMTEDEAIDVLDQALLKVYKEKEEEITPEHLRQIEKMVFLHSIDTKWKEHLYNMDRLKESVGIRSFGQKDPLLEYKKEGFDMFQAMYDSIFYHVAEVVFKVQKAGEQRQEGVFSALPKQMVHNEVSAIGQAKQASSSGGGTAVQPPPMPQQRPASSMTGPAGAVKPAGQRETPKVGRNEPCPCGSGLKYKKCCGK